MEQPLVSIALATYNGSRFLRAQLDSLVAQTYTNFELVITDDGSTDDTAAVVQEYAQKDTRIRFSRSARERGFINNFVGAIDLCRGDIIFLCDQDDVWYQEKIAHHVKAYSDSRIMWAYNRVRLINEDGKALGYMTDTFKDYYGNRRRWILNYVWGSCILGCATSYRSSAIRKFLPPDTAAAAHDSWLQMALWPMSPAAIDEVLQDYRMHGSNTSDFKLSRTKEEESALEAKAMRDNMERLISFARNPKLQIWKRILFFLAYAAKKTRLVYRRVGRIIT